MAEQPDLPDPAELPVGEDRLSARPAAGERIGVYVCHCGGNISDVVDVDRVAQELGQDEDVAVARHVMFMCSDEGQQSITDDIRDLQLDRVIVAACTPKLHETTFRKTVIRGGMNPYLFLPANIREQVSWAHPHDHEAATDKAIAVVQAAVAKARLLQPLEMVRVIRRPSHPRHRRWCRGPAFGARSRAPRARGRARRGSRPSWEAGRPSCTRSIRPRRLPAHWSAA